MVVGKLTGNRHVLMVLGRALKWFEDYESEPADRWLHAPWLEAERAHFMALATDNGASAAELEAWPVVIGRAQTIDGVEVEASDARAWRFSLPGVIEWAAFKHVLATEGSRSPELSQRLAGQCYRAVERAVERMCQGGYAPWPNVPAFNDSPATTFECVLSALRLAITLEAGGVFVSEEGCEFHV